MSDAYPTPVAAADVAVGDAGPECVVGPFEREDFVRYAGASGDFNPLHYDGPYAREVGHPDVVAQGMLTAGIAAHIAADWFGLANVSRFGVRFRAVVFPGDTITVTGAVTDVSRTDDGTTVDATLQAERQTGETVLTGSVRAQLPPSAAESG